MLGELEKAAAQGLIDELDFHFARFIGELAHSNAPELLLAACLVSRQTGEGNVCVDLGVYADKPLFRNPRQEAIPDLIAPSLDVWKTVLSATDVVGKPGDPAPLILDQHHRLYLGRYWQFESDLVAQVLSRVAQPWEAVDLARLKEGLARLFPTQGVGPDWQMIAAAIAVLQRFAVISGGPGTGKTTTVTRILALLMEQSRPARIRIALAAPTGKAAARLTESIKQAKTHLDCDPTAKEAIPEEASTIHRLLGGVPERPRFRHHADNPLHLDVLVVDEASMVDLPLMARLVDALPARARLILLGDKDQLSSVEAGSVLGDICDSGQVRGYSPSLVNVLNDLMGCRLETTDDRSQALIRDSIVVLRKSYRFGSDSGIGTLAKAVNSGAAKAAVASLDAKRFEDIAWHSVTAAQLPARLAEIAVEGYGAYLNATDPFDVLEQFNRFRVLCALREGPFGVEQVNRYIELALQQRRLIRTEGRWYAGRPVMIKRNDYHLRLFNGDIGIVLRDPAADHRLRAYFIMPDGSVRKILPNRLPEHETAYAMTIHKSQGSEFAHTVIILPDIDAPVLTRELIYTAITRAKQRADLWATEAIFKLAIARRVERSSGLKDALWRNEE